MTKQDPRTAVKISGDLAGMVLEAERALAVQKTPTVFQRDGKLVRVVRRGAKKLTRGGRPGASISPHTHGSLQLALSEVTRWQKRGARSRKQCEALPPRDVVRALLEKGEWSLLELNWVVDHPTLLPTGELLVKPGFHEASGILLTPQVTFPAVPTRPTGRDVERAIERLLDPLCDFPFLQDADRSAVLATLLALIARPAIRGPVPLLAIRKNTPGSGGSLLADVIASIATGRPAARSFVTRNEEELQKSLLALARGAVPLVLLDNVDGPLGSATLAAALTSGLISARELGKNEVVEGRFDTVFIANGNGLSLRGDMGRRVLFCELSTDLEHPEDRSGFRYDPLLEHVLGIRSTLITAALTLLQAHVVAGRPSHGQAPMGSFESWDRVVRAALIWAGLPDPLATAGRVREEGDAEVDALRRVHALWLDRFERPVLLRDVIRKCEEDDDLKDSLLELCGHRSDHLNPRTLGNCLKKHRDRLIEGRRFEAAGKDGQTKSVLWTVTEALERGPRVETESLSVLKQKEEEKERRGRESVPATTR